MGHLTTRNYLKLQRRLDRFFPGAPGSDSFYEILKILFSDEEARLCSVMPLNYFPADLVAKTWGKTVPEATAILRELGNNGLVYKFQVDGSTLYFLAPPVLGFFEFSLMRLDGKFDRKRLSEFYHRYLTVEGDFLKELISVYPQIGRTLVQEDSLADLTTEVMPYERSTYAVDSASCITVGTCFCRHRMEHMGLACDNPQDVCLTFNHVAQHLADHGIARVISKDEAHQILHQCVERGLVQIGDNKKSQFAII
jgi:hypothetical protein